jgi:hypothetical protein
MATLSLNIAIGRSIRASRQHSSIRLAMIASGLLALR